MPSITKNTVVRDFRDEWSLEDIGRGAGWKPIPPYKRNTQHVLGQDGRWRAGGALSGAWDFSEGTSDGILSVFDLDEGAASTTYSASTVDLDNGTSE
jgi:hypothetical protein